MVWQMLNKYKDFILTNGPKLSFLTKFINKLNSDKPKQ